MNSEFVAEIKYEKNIDKAFFNAIIIFNYDTVGKESYAYNVMK